MGGEIGVKYRTYRTGYGVIGCVLYVIRGWLASKNLGLLKHITITAITLLINVLYDKWFEKSPDKEIGKNSAKHLVKIFRLVRKSN